MSTPRSGPVPAVAYYRMSTDKQEASIPSQRQAVQAYAAKHGYVIIREYIDEGISGDATEKRVGFRRMLGDAGRLGDFEAVLCWDQDRFGRFDPLEAGYWVKPLRDAGIWLETVAQGRIDWNDFAGRIVYAVQQEGKHAFLRDLARNETRGKLKAAREGRWNGGKPPYGYTVRDGRLVPGDPAEVSVLRELFTRFASGRDGLRALARDLNARNVAPPSPDRGKPDTGHRGWHYSVIRKILANPLYTGDLVWNRRHEGRYCGVEKNEVMPEARSVRHHNPKDDHVIFGGCHEALVDRETFERVAGRLAECRGGKAPLAGVPFALSGLVVCAQCGRNMHGVTMRRPNQVYRHYVCSTYVEKGKGVCGHNRAPEEPLLACVLRKIREECQPPRNMDRLRAALRAKVNGADVEARLKELQAQAAELDRQLANGRARYLSARPELAAGLEATLLEWEARREQVRRELQDVERRRAADQADVDARVEKAVGVLGRLELVGPKAPPKLLRALVQEAVVKVVCTFEQVQRACYRRSLLVGGVIRLRPDLEITRLGARALAWTP